MPIGILGADLAPFAGPRRAHGASMDPGIDPRDQVELPRPALDLPGSETDQRQEHHQRDEAEGGAAQGRRRGRGAGPARGLPVVGGPDQGALCMTSWADIGIMLLLRWYITQTEPESMIVTSVIVKIIAMKVQPCSECVFMCRK